MVSQKRIIWTGLWETNTWLMGRIRFFPNYETSRHPRVSTVCHHIFPAKDYHAQCFHMHRTTVLSTYTPTTTPILNVHLQSQVDVRGAVVGRGSEANTPTTTPSKFYKVEFRGLGSEQTQPLLGHFSFETINNIRFTWRQIISVYWNS